MTNGVLRVAAVVERKGKRSMGTVGTALIRRSLAAQVNVNAMAAIVQAMMAGGRAVLEDGEWLRAQAVTARLAPQEHAALEALRARLQSGASFIHGSSATIWYG